MSISAIPDTYNVYGYLCCGDNIMRLKKGFILAFTLNNDKIYFDKGILKINSPAMEIKVERQDTNRRSLNTALSGDNAAVIEAVTKLAQQFKWFGIHSQHEVYNTGFECIFSIES